jgi:hypothetical protein
VRAGADACLDLELFLIVRQEGEIIGKLGGSFYSVFSAGYGEFWKEGGCGGKRNRRGSALGAPGRREPHMANRGIEIGRDGIFLALTEEQYEKLRRRAKKVNRRDQFSTSSSYVPDSHSLLRVKACLLLEVSPGLQSLCLRQRQGIGWLRGVQDHVVARNPGAP